MLCAGFMPFNDNASKTKWHETDWNELFCGGCYGMATAGTKIVTFVFWTVNIRRR